MRSIEKHLADLQNVGIRAVAIAADTTEDSKKLRADEGYTFPILSDPKTEAIRRYDLLHAHAGISGNDIARPAEFLIDSTGTVRWVNLTENYWVRARPEQIVSAAKALQ